MTSNNDRKSTSSICCFASFCGRKRRRRKVTEHSENGPYNNDNPNRDISESPVPEAPVATPELSDEESPKQDFKNPISGSSMVSIDREDALEDATKAPATDTQDRDIKRLESDEQFTQRDKSVHDELIEDILKYLPQIPKFGGPDVPSYWGSSKQLYSRTGYHLAIFPNGTVRGVRDEYHPYAALELRSPATAEVWIKGQNTELYLTMNSNGRLYGQPQACHERSIFYESYEGGYNRYLSKKYYKKKWFVGIKKSGKAKPGHKTKPDQKAVQFLPRATKAT